MTHPASTLYHRLRGHVSALASDIGERNIFRLSPGASPPLTTLADAARYIQQQWAEQGYEVFTQVYWVPTTTQHSSVYVGALRTRGVRVAWMLSLETIGYYRDEPRSQRYPFPFALFYPDRANFIGFVSNLRSRRAMLDVVRTFRKLSGFPTEHLGVALAPEAGWSDHLSFWRKDFVGFMATDTAPFRYPYYHASEDTPDKLDYERLAQVTEGLAKTVAALAS